jgi:hypothetical protein
VSADTKTGCSAAFPLRGYYNIIPDKSQRKKGKKISQQGCLLVILSAIRSRHSAIRLGCRDGEKKNILHYVSMGGNAKLFEEVER